MEAAKLKTYTLTRGDTYQEIFKAENEDGTPFDLTYYDEIYMDIRRGDSEEAELLLAFEIGDGITFEGVNDLLVFEKPFATTQELKSGLVYRDMRFIKDGRLFTQAKGLIEIDKNITKAPK